MENMKKVTDYSENTVLYKVQKVITGAVHGLLELKEQIILV